jgi:hypothetical protein
MRESKRGYYSYAWYHHPTQWQGITSRQRLRKIGDPNCTARFPTQELSLLDQNSHVRRAR